MIDLDELEQDLYTVHSKSDKDAALIAIGQQLKRIADALETLNLRAGS